MNTFTALGIVREANMSDKDIVVHYTVWDGEVRIDVGSASFGNKVGDYLFVTTEPGVTKTIYVKHITAMEVAA